MRFAEQTPDGYGTGFAVKCGITGGGLEDYEGEIAVLSGDVPLIKRSTVEEMIALHRASGAKCTLLSCRSKRSLPFGRIIRDSDGRVTGIKEHKDCTEQERKIDELNVGAYIFDATSLRASLAKLKNNNAQNEYYLTDVPLLMLENGNISKRLSQTTKAKCLGNTPEDLVLSKKRCLIGHINKRRFFHRFELRKEDSIVFITAAAQKRRYIRRYSMTT